MMAKLMGARVYAASGRAAPRSAISRSCRRQEGVAVAERLGSAWPSHVYHWHREGFDCPAGATMLATGDDFPTQAILVGPKAFGLQFHPEVTHAMMCRWTVRAAHRLELPGAQDRSRQIEGRFMYDPHVASWLDSFLDHWLGEPKKLARAQDPPRGANEPLGRLASRTFPDQPCCLSAMSSSAAAELPAGTVERRLGLRARRSPGAGAPRA